nr:hypothetical protein TetV2_00264 [Oceanusvirus sp.]
MGCECDCDMNDEYFFDCCEEETGSDASCCERAAIGRKCVCDFVCFCGEPCDCKKRHFQDILNNERWETWKPRKAPRPTGPKYSLMSMDENHGLSSKLTRTPVHSDTGGVDLLGGPCDNISCALYLDGDPISFFDHEAHLIVIDHELVYHRACCKGSHPRAWEEAIRISKSLDEQNRFRRSACALRRSLSLTQSGV